MERKGFLKNNLANFFTILRFFFAFWFIYLALEDSQLILMSVLVFGAVLTDVFDGWMARKLKIETPMGGFLDRLADKIFICPIIIILVWKYWPTIEDIQPLKFLTAGLVTVVILLEFILVMSGFFGLIKKLEISANKWGKRKMFFQSAAVVAWMLLVITDVLILYWLVNLFLIVAVVLAVKSLEGYYLRWQDKEDKSSSSPSAFAREGNAKP